jgi:hypothetical protein
VLPESSVIWVITLCSLLKVNQRFGGTHCLHLQGRRVSQGRYQLRLAATSALLCCQLNCTFLLCLLFHLEAGGDMCLRKVGWLSPGNMVLCPGKKYTLLWTAGSNTALTAWQVAVRTASAHYVQYKMSSDLVTPCVEVLYHQISSVRQSETNRNTLYVKCTIQGRDRVTCKCLWSVQKVFWRPFRSFEPTICQFVADVPSGLSLTPSHGTNIYTRIRTYIYIYIC